MHRCSFKHLHCNGFEVQTSDIKYRKFLKMSGGKNSRNLIWWIQNIIKFGRNLIWWITKNVNFSKVSSPKAFEEVKTIR